MPCLPGLNTGRLHKLGAKCGLPEVRWWSHGGARFWDSTAQKTQKAPKAQPKLPPLAWTSLPKNGKGGFW